MPTLRFVLPSTLLMLVLLAPATSHAVCCGANCCCIDGTIYGRGDTDPENACQECDPSTDQRNWTSIPGCTPPDAGPAEPDAGSTEPDAGPVAIDAGSGEPPDAGSATPMDAGSTGGPDAGGGDGGGGGCSVAPRRSGAPLAFLLAAGAMALAWRRRLN